MLKQLSIYAENKKGALQVMTNALYEAGINIWGSVTNDGAEYGINRMVVSDPDKAKEVLTDKGYLCRFFKDNFHMTFVEYVQRVRLQKAERLLRETDDPVGKIALDVGFGSGNYFTTEFGKLYHTTPQKYRKGQDT